MKVKEFGRTPGGCVCNVLAVLSDGEESMRATLGAAVELAESARARLTLVKTCEQGRAYVWIAPFAVGSAYIAAELESPDEAWRALSRLVEEVPDSIPVTMHVLPPDSQTALLKLLRERHFGAFVADRDQLWLWRRVRRQLRREQLQVVLVSPHEPAPSPAAQPAVEAPARDPAFGLPSLGGLAAATRSAP
jgi:hypothetical protein